ncbi:MAG: methyltransferase domain-containing protein [Candidatus Poseidoniaceae archaeon]|jgi:tRNA (guanine10-N2)-dimethyltransferase|nr:methyltransferase domain-containing protein [Candidatus Poseidoniaceae archaeon]
MVVLSLRGWHPAIARFEAMAMFPELQLERTPARRLLVGAGESDWERTEKLSGTECVLIDGGISEWTTIDELLSMIKVEPVQNMSVICWRHEGKLATSTKEIERRIGEMFHSKGSTINLTNPENRFGVILDASAGLVAWGWMSGQGPGTHGWSAMNANNRPYFKPISLEPRIARAAVNIAAGTSKGVVLDPMCGTGGLLIEAALCNRSAIGIDIDPEMVNGTKQNLQWANVTAEVILGDATNFEFPQNLSGVVIDPPYGRNSQLSESTALTTILGELVKQLKSCSLVLILPMDPGLEDLDEEIECNLEIPGFLITACLGIPVHKSLGRMMIIAKTLG